MYKPKEIWNHITRKAELSGFMVNTKKGKNYEVYIDGDDIVQVDDKTGKERKITFSSFQRYVTKIKKNLKKNRTN